MVIMKHPFHFALHIWVRQHMPVKLLQWRLLAAHQLEEAGIQGFDTRTSVCNRPSDKFAAFEIFTLVKCRLVITKKNLASLSLENAKRGLYLYHQESRINQQKREIQQFVLLCSSPENICYKTFLKWLEVFRPEKLSLWSPHIICIFSYKLNVWWMGPTETDSGDCFNGTLHKLSPPDTNGGYQAIRKVILLKSSQDGGKIHFFLK